MDEEQTSLHRDSQVAKHDRHPRLYSLERPSSRDDLASVWANQGLALLKENTRTALESALNCFEKAIELREPLLACNDPWFHYNLAGVWINRADVLLRLEATRHFTAALSAYDRAVEVMQGLPVEENPVFCRRLAIAWLNRGNALVQTDERLGLPEAIRSFAEAARAASSCSGDESVAGVAAAAWANQADAWGREGSWEEGRDAAQRAIAGASPWERRNADLAVIGLKGRLCLCLFASRLLADEGPNPAKGAQISTAIDAAEEGLDLAGHWKEDARLGLLAGELFRLGAEAYAARQPQFLVEFLHDYLPLARLVAPGSEPENAARRAIAFALSRVTRTAFAGLDRPKIAQTLATFRELRLMAGQLGS